MKTNLTINEKILDAYKQCDWELAKRLEREVACNLAYIHNGIKYCAFTDRPCIESEDWQCKHARHQDGARMGLAGIMSPFEATIRSVGE